MRLKRLRDAGHGVTEPEQRNRDRALLGRADAQRAFRGNPAALAEDRARDLGGKWIVEAKLPSLGATKADSYEGYVIVRHESTDMVRKMVKKVIETMKVHYAE